MSNINDVNWVEFGLFISGIIASFGALLKISQSSKCDYIKICWGCLDCSRKPEINFENNNNNNEDNNEAINLNNV